MYVEVLAKLVVKVVSSELDSKTVSRMFNKIVCGKARYYMAAGIWTKHRAEVELERLLRSKLSEAGFHYRTASLERLYLPREQGGRGLTSMSQTHDLAVLARHFIVRRLRKSSHVRSGKLLRVYHK